MIQQWSHEKRYGVEGSYYRGMEWLKNCDMVEDWGCALCHARKYRDTHAKKGYRGIDGTAGKADVIADLSTYRSLTDGLFMRHVLEHNLDWRIILNNALSSFTKRMSLIMFLQLSECDEAPEQDPSGPITLQISGPDLREMIAPYVQMELRVKKAEHKIDTVFLLEK